MKRIELFRKTGICITAFALSAAIGAAAPMLMTASASGEIQPPDSPIEALTDDPAVPEDDPAEEDDSGKDDSKKDDSSDSDSSESSDSSGSASQAENGKEDPAQPGKKDTGEESSGGGSGQEEPTGKENNTAQKGAANSSKTDAPDTGGSQIAGGVSSGDPSGSSGPGGSSPSSSQAASVSSSIVSPTGSAAGSEAPAADTETNQPRQTAASVEPTGKYKDKGTTLDPGEVPDGYKQTLNHNGSNEDLIASQNIVSGLSIMKDDFRFYTIDKVSASSARKQSVYEDMKSGSGEIGLLSQNDILYILSEEEGGWLYIESGNVRGFIKSEDIRQISESGASGDVLSFASETVPASENSAFAYKRCTTKSTVVDKDYAVADVDTMILESTADNAREIGHLAPGSLCYVIQQANEKWSYVESGNVRGFARTTNLATGTAAKKIVQKTGEVSMTGAEEYVAPADNRALYYTLNSVHDGVVYSSVRTEIVEAAAKCIGNPYVWGGTSLTRGADCSGFVQTLYKMFGYSIPRVADAQSGYGVQIPISDAAPGDLIFFASKGYVYHVALYAGDGMTIEAYSEKRGIIATPIGGRDAVWATRVIED